MSFSFSSKVVVEEFVAMSHFLEDVVVEPVDVAAERTVDDPTLLWHGSM